MTSLVFSLLEDLDLERALMECKYCGHWNRFEVKRVLVEQPVSEPKVKAFIRMYFPLKTENCKKCGKNIAEPKELIRIMKTEH